jgi:hypothetical protein
MHQHMLANTALLLLEELREAPSASVFDKGYRQGMARALDVLRLEAEAFGVADTVGLLSDFEYGDWVG